MEIPTTLEPRFLCNVGCDNRAFATREERQAHFDATGHGKDNLISRLKTAFPGAVAVESRSGRQLGGSTAAPAKPKPAGEPATPKQFGYLRTLLAERAGNPEAEKIRTAMNEMREAGFFDKKAASAAIKALLEIPKNPVKVVNLPELPDVPAGRYAVENEDGDLRFYHVNRPTEGKWAGRTFVKVQASDDLHAVRGKAAASVLAKIAADVDTAGRRYGQELGVCGDCGRTLTDAESRARGRGPICEGKGR